MIKVGLVGMGYWGPNLARVLNQTSKCEFSACCDVDSRKVEKTVRQYPNVMGFLTLDEMLATDLDAIVIATPISTHYQVARRALEAGKHIMVEKPLAHQGDLARELVAMAHGRGKTLLTGHTFIYSPPVRKVRELIQRGELGEIYYISLSRVNLGLFQKDVDVVWDLAVHDISILLYWLDEMPIRGASFGRSCVQDNKRDVAFLWLEFPGGVVASSEVSWLSPQKMRRTCIVGSRRMIVYDDTELSDKIKIYDRGVDFKRPENYGEFQLSYRTGDMIAPHLANVEPLLQEIEHFIHCVETGERSLTCDNFGAGVVEVLEMVQAGRPLERAWQSTTELVAAAVAK
jgi:predicted dehydrogenase